MKKNFKKLILIFFMISTTMLLAVCNDAHVCKYDRQIVKASYLFSMATCDSPAIYYYSCKCGAKGNNFFETGESLGHYYGDFVCNQDGTHSRVCLNDNSHVITENCYGGTPTTTNKPICIACNSEYGSTLAHEHNFNKKVIANKYLFSSATCVQKAKYYYSCECGQKGVETFEHGNLIDHEYVSCVSNGDGTHTKTCKNDANHKLIEACSGGSATQTEKAVCSICKSPYGDALGHTHSYTQKVVKNKYMATPATCENAATYYYSCECGKKGAQTFSHGNALGHVYGNWKSNGDNTHSKYCANDATHKITENCHGGTATETKKPVCEGCKCEYGNFLIASNN